MSSIEGAASRLGQPDVTAAELAQIAGAHPALRTLVAQHPAAYPELRAWIAAAGTPSPVASAPTSPIAAAQVAVAPEVQAPAVGSPASVPSVAPRPTPRRGAPAWVPWAVAALAVLVAAGSWLWPHPGSAATTGTSRSTAVPSPGGTGAADSASTFAADEQTFATPQAAVTFLAQRLAAGDAAGAVTAFATTSAVNGYDFVVATNRMGYLLPGAWMPSSSPYYRTLDLGQRASEITGALRRMTWSIVDPQYDGSSPIEARDKATATDLASRLDPAAMSHLAVLRVDVVGAAHQAATAVFPQLAAPYGADQYAEYGVLYDTANGPMSGGVSFLRYGDRWLILSLSSALMGNEVGKLTSTTEAQYVASLG